MGNFTVASTNREQTLFIKGFKKAFWILQAELQQNDTLLRMEFPYLLIKNHILFFQNELIKNMFIQKGGVNPNEFLGVNECILGEFLGYPPQAIQNYKQGIKKEEMAKVNYHGLFFATKKKHVWDDLSYLLFHMPIPKKEQTNVSIKILNQKSSKVLEHSQVGGKWETVLSFVAGEHITKENIRL